MICPDCKVKMIDISYFYPDYKKYMTGQWEQEDLTNKHEEYLCLNCRIKYSPELINLAYGHNGWILNDTQKPTQKQLNAIWHCYDKLDIPAEERPITRNQARAFLDKYMKLSSSVPSTAGKYNSEIDQQREEARIKWEKGEE